MTGITAGTGICCPRCRAVSYPGLMGFPRCHKCHEQLRQCRYCAHQQDGLCLLDEAVRPRLEEDDGKPFCAAFASRPALADDAQTPRHITVGPLQLIGGAALLVALLACYFAWLANREPTTYRIKPVGRGFEVIDSLAVARFVVRANPNLGDEVSLQISEPVFQYYDLDPQSIEPQPRNPKDRRHLYHFDLPPDGKLHVQMTFRAHPHAPPRVPLEVKVKGLHGDVEATGQAPLINGEAWR